MNHQPDNTITPTLLLAAVTLLTALVLGSAPASARTGDRSERAEFRAGRSTERAGVVEFSSGFELTQGSLTINSDSARLFRNNSGELVRIEILGTSAVPAKWREELDDGSALNAQAERIDYHLADEKAVLVGQALVKKGADEMRADTINYDLNSQHLDAGGDDDSPVLFIYNPPSTTAADKP
ncbi:MAG: lipopolysaccharide transport periplasmic protein LptA [Lysobacterales bacterium]